MTAAEWLKPADAASTRHAGGGWPGAPMLSCQSGAVVSPARCSPGTCGGRPVSGVDGRTASVRADERSQGGRASADVAQVHGREQMGMGTAQHGARHHHWLRACTHTALH